MCLLIRVLTLATLLCCWPITNFTQTPDSDSADVMRDLLALPAPPPRPRYVAADIQPKKERPAKFFDKANPPPDNAPLEDVLVAVRA